jgi:hypothetical protein
MKDVLEYIEARRAAYAELPLFRMLRDPGDDPARALAFMRHAAHFVMSFADLNKHCWRDDENPFGWQEDVNAHTREDDHHFPWYLSDLIALGLDRPMPLTEALQFLWSDANRETRLLSYRLWSLSEGRTPLELMILIEAIEATGLVFFGSLVDCAAKIPAGCLSRPLIYVAEHHFAVEQGHSAGKATHDERLADVDLSPTEREHYLDMVDKVFDLFIAWSAELHGHAVALRQPAAETTSRAA